MKDSQRALDAITDKVLSYRPARKQKKPKIQSEVVRAAKAKPKKRG
jgi:hypothetical protein